MKESLKKTLKQLCLIMLLFVSTISVTYAQYTLTDADVVVTGGIIQSCSYDFVITDIIIPSTLDGQTVTGIADGESIYTAIFYNKGITSLVLPSTLTMIGNCAFNTNEITNVDLSACTLLTSIGGSAFYYNSLTELDLSSCTSLSSIGESAFIWNEISNLNFTNCSSLSSIGTYAFAHGRLINLDLSPCTSLTLIDANAFYNNHNDDYSTYLTTFYLPSPDIDGYKLDYWADGNSVHYSGGDAVSDLETSYTANLSEAYDVTFTVTDGTNPVANATVSLTGYGTVTTNASGVAVIADVVPASNISYSVTEKSYSPASGTVSVVAANVSEAVSLSVLTTYTLTDDDVVVTGGVIQSCSYDFTIKNIIIPESLDGQTVIGIKDGTSLTSGVFYNKSIESVVLPGTLTFIGDFVFRSNSLTSLDLSACTSLTTIGSWAFSNNTIIDVVFPSGITDMGSASFNKNKIITINGVASDGIIYARNDDASIDNTSIVSYGGVSNIVIVPAQVEVIVPHAFRYNTITNIDFSACTALTNIGDWAFEDNSIASLDLSNCTSLSAIGMGAFRANSISSIDFNNCSNLNSIGSYAFNSNSLSSIDLSPCTALRLIESYAFYSNSGLTSFALPAPDYTGFSGWQDGKSNSYSAGASVSDFTTFYHAVIPYTLTDDDVVVTDGIIQSCSYDFSFTDIIIPETLDGQAVIGIKDGGYSTGVFYNKGITSVVFPASLTFIGDYTFRSNSITSVDFSACTNLTSIGYYSFAYNQIINIDLSSCTALTDIEGYAFTSNSISNINISTCSNLKTIGSYAFYYNSLSSLDLSFCTSLSSIDYYAFYHNSLSSLDLSTCSALTTIGEYAFSYNSIDEVSLPGSITSMGRAAFNSNKITKINGVSSDGIFYAYNADASVDSTTIVSYGGISSTIAIPEKVITIGTYAFRSSSLASIDFSSCVNLTTIEDYAFFSNNLTSIDLSACSALIYIGPYAFNYNYSMASFALPSPDYTGFQEWIDGKGNNYIAGDLVTDYTTFYRAVIPYTLTDEDVVVTNGVIQSCSYDFTYKDIIIPGTLDGQSVIGIRDAASYSEGVFYNKGISSIVFPATLDSIGNYAFHSNAISSADFSACASLVSIGEYAFAYNTLKSLDLSVCSGLVSIASYAFRSNALSSIDLSNCAALKSIGNYAFLYNSLTSVDFSTCITLETIGASAFASNVITSVDFSYCAALTTIGVSAFRSNSLSSIDLSACTALTYIGTYAFYNNSSLSPFNLPTPDYTGFLSWMDGNGNSYAAGASVSDFETLYHAVIPYTLTDDDVVVTDGIIESCSYDFTYTDIIIPGTLDGQTVTGIKDGSWSSGVFYNKGMTSVVLPASLNYIGAYVFRYNSLTTIDLNVCTGLTFIGSNAFQGNSLKNLDLSANTQLIEIGENAFGSNLLVNVNLASCASLTTIGSYAFYYNAISNLDLSGCTSLTSIAYAAFYYNSISSLNLSTCAALTSIGGYAFNHNSLTEITLPNSITSIGAAAFNNNKISTINGAASDGIIYARNEDASVDNTIIVSYGGVSTTVAIPAQVVSIGTEAFRDNSLSSVDFSTCLVLKTIGNYAFYNNALTNIDLSSCTSLTYIGSYAFYSNSGLGSFNLPNITYDGFESWLDGSGNDFAGGDAVTSFNTYYWAKILYTLTDDDVVVTDGVIQSCSYDFTFTDIIIPETLDGQSVTGIKHGNWNDGVFYNRGMTSVKLPNSLTFIGNYAFSDNYLVLADFSACSALISIGHSSFEDNRLVSLDLSSCSLLNTIENNAFASSNLTSVDLTSCNVLSTIGNYAFYYNDLTNIDLSSCTALKTIGYEAFYNNNLTGIDLSNCTSLTFIGGYAFYSNSFTDFTLPTPDIAFADFNYWLDGGDNQFAGGALVNNLYTSYTAKLTGTLSVTFTVTDGSNPISGATIEFGNYPSAFSDGAGVASFTTVLPENDIAYTVYASNYGSVSGTISVVDSDVYKDVQLVLTGFKELSSVGVNVYPNPVMDVLTITQPSNEIISGVEIYNLQGQKIKTETVINNQSKIKLNVQELNKGNYILRCITRNNIYSITITKE